MFQTFAPQSSPEQGPPRLAALRRAMKDENVVGFLIPRADAHQGEYVAPCDDRLAWLTGFTGSAGFACALEGIAGVFIDGRYREQVKAQVALSDFTPVHWPETQLGDWLKGQLPEGGIVGFDPWLHTLGEISKLRARLKGTEIVLQRCPNLVDLIWADRPAPPQGQVIEHPLEFAGQSSHDKRHQIAAELTKADQKSVVLTLPDSICWLLNIRGHDIPRNPVVQCFAILHADARVDLFIDAAKMDGIATDPDIACHKPADFRIALGTLSGPVRVDKATAPLAITNILKGGDIEIAYDDDPCIMPKACKNDVEIAGARAAHARDAAAMAEFLAWLDAQPADSLTEIDVARTLEGFRQATDALRDISFDTISGTGPHGAIVHYRVTEETNATVQDGQLLLVDSGGQYQDGTTDVTRTIAIGTVGETEKQCFTRVLQGVIAISRARFPKGVAGAHLDALARAPLWMAGLDYDHGTGHGVGSFLSVHEGPQRISRVSDTPLQSGMILSNEPGYYRAGAFGIRIENLIVVRTAPKIDNQDDRAMLDFETLTYVPIDTRLIVAEMLSSDEKSWLNAYHGECAKRLEGQLSPEAALWLTNATQPI
jgi:Xaa-Pro aminopeptidase